MFSIIKKAILTILPFFYLLLFFIIFNETLYFIGLVTKAIFHIFHFHIDFYDYEALIDIYSMFIALFFAASLEVNKKLLFSFNKLLKNTFFGYFYKNNGKKINIYLFTTLCILFFYLPSIIKENDKIKVFFLNVIFYILFAFFPMFLIGIIKQYSFKIDFFKKVLNKSMIKYFSSSFFFRIEILCIVCSIIKLYFLINISFIDLLINFKMDFSIIFNIIFLFMSFLFILLWCNFVIIPEDFLHVKIIKITRQHYI